MIIKMLLICSLPTLYAGLECGSYPDCEGEGDDEDYNNGDLPVTPGRWHGSSEGSSNLSPQSECM